ncbi:MAG: hypothetical protein AUH30_10280 [Candidatus Rokubacteria bacterium 13_1_40CM_68_15]|nr:MAG: hypothetical protein AUH30_10280 [Candidatus Rokubacteria bacterium 13_1_40CM_68_15]
MRGVEQIPWLYDAFATLSDWRGLRRWRQWLAAGARGDVLKRAALRAPGVRLVQARAEELPFRDGAFDTVVSGLVFCSVGDPARGLAEIRRVLTAGGELRMMEHVRSPVPWRARWEDRIQPLWTRLTGGCHPNRDTEAAVEASGFRIAAQTRRAEGVMRRFAARVE